MNPSRAGNTRPPSHKVICMSLFRKRPDDPPGSMKNLYGVKGTDEIDEANKRYFGDSSESIQHSRYYHRYFEGYTEVRTPNPDNKYKPYRIQRIYTAPYTVADMDGHMYRVYMIFYGLLTLAALLLYVSALTDRAVSINMNKLAALTVMVTLVPLFLLTACLIAYYLRPKRMKCFDYRTSTGRLKGTAAASSAGCLLTVVIFCVYLCAAGSMDLKAEIFYIVRLIMASAACLAVFLLERRMAYKQIPNDVKLPEGEYHRIQ